MPQRSRFVPLSCALVAVSLLAACPARRVAQQAAYAPRHTPPCANLDAVLVGGNPPRAVVLRAHGRGRGSCEIWARELVLRYRPETGALVVARPFPPGVMSMEVPPGQTVERRFALTLPTPLPECKLALSGAFGTRDRRASAEISAGRISEVVRCSQELAR